MNINSQKYLEMKKLDDIPKKSVFEAPEGYFDRLPGIIQARLVQDEVNRKTVSGWLVYLGYSLKYALPVVAIAVASFFYLNMPGDQSTEDLLASVDTGYLVAYLEDADVSTEDLLENVSLDQDEASAIQESTMDEIIVNDQDAEVLKNEFAIDQF